VTHFSLTSFVIIWHILFHYLIFIFHAGSGDGSVYAWNVRSGKVARWGSTDSEPPLIRWAPGSLMFLTASSELSCWVPDLSKLGSFTVSK
jgi:COMPASS component SWD2